MTRLLITCIGQTVPEHCFTIIQLNRNYTAKLHVDVNNHWTSEITAFGDYTNGKVYLLAQKDPLGKKLTKDAAILSLRDAMMGWPSLNIDMILL